MKTILFVFFFGVLLLTGCGPTEQPADERPEPAPEVSIPEVPEQEAPPPEPIDKAHYSTPFDESSVLDEFRSENAVVKDRQLEFTTGSRRSSGMAMFTQNMPVPTNAALEISVQINPTLNDESGAQIDTGLSVGMVSANADPNRFAEAGNKVYIELTEFEDKVRFTITLDGQCISFWNRLRMTGGLGLPNIIDRHDGFYDLKIVAIPRGEETGLRFFVDHTDRPLRLFNYDKQDFVMEWRLPRKLTENNFIGLYARNGSGKEAVTTFDNLTIRRIPIEEAEDWMTADEFVMANINYDHPTMKEVKVARDAGDMELAKKKLVEYFRTREEPRGPELDLELSRATAHGKEANWKEVSDNALQGIYAKLSWFHGFSEPGELSRENGMPDWKLDPGFLNRHYHWDVMAYAWQRTQNPAYARRVGDELIDYLQQEPVINFHTEGLGGMASMDGTVISEHILWTGNIGRRLELTWWQMFEVLRKSPGFSDEAILSYLDGVIRQCRLLCNHTVFLPWDDSGMHGAMALTKSSILFPMADEADQWAEIGWDRINYVVDKQFHPDGSHVSLSTGYNWATIRGIEHFYKYMTENGAEVPDSMKERIENMYFHPWALTRPDFGSIDLNDGGWGIIGGGEGALDNVVKWFPERTDYLFFNTLGKEGEQPDPVSMYFPNAGQYLMRTGWGEGEQYLFFGAGPWGASHGKMDAMNIYTALGDQLLIRNAGRGAYSGVGNTVHAGKTASFNVPFPDWGGQNSIPHHQEDMAVGFNPPNRRWVSNENFDFGEGAFEYGWSAPGEHIAGKHLRQVVFVKGENPKKTGYYIVFDTVEPETDREYTWRNPWQLGPDNIKILDDDKSILASNAKAAVRIIPVDPAGNMSVEIIKGQPKPHLLGWRVNHETAKPWPVPTYSWKATNTFSKAWIIMMQDADQNWPVESVQVAKGARPGECMFRIRRTDGGSDMVARRFPDADPVAMLGKQMDGDVVIVSTDAKGGITATLNTKNGENSVAKSRGIALKKAEPNLSERFVESGAVTLSQDAAPLVINGSFEEPEVAVERGIFEQWEFSSAAGTGTWPVERAEARGTYYGRQVAVVAAGGWMGQIIRNEKGEPIALTPGLKLRVKFSNLRHNTMNNINLGVYIVAGEPMGGNVVTPLPLKADQNQPKEITMDFTVISEKQLDALFPAGWEKIPLYLKFVGYAGRAVIDRVQVGNVHPDGSVVYGKDDPGPKGETDTAPAAAPAAAREIKGTIKVVNGSFESPVLQVERGSFDSWDFNSIAGTGTWPVSRAGATGEADGRQVAVVHANGFIGQILKNEAGEPLPVVPGTQIEVSFLNLPHNEMNNVNMGIYLLAGKKDGGRIAEAIPFRKDRNVAGEFRHLFTVYPEAKLGSAAPGWQSDAVYLMFRGFADRVVMDDVQVRILK